MRAGEASEYSEKHQNVKKLTLDNLQACPKRSVLLVEDLIHMTKKEELNLRHSLTYDAHHKLQKIYCVSHTIHKNSVWTLVQLFTYLIFTSNSGNLPLLRLVLNYFKLDPKFVELCVNFFKSKQNLGYTYFYFNSSSGFFGWSGDLLKPGTLFKVVDQAEDASESGEPRHDSENLKSFFSELTKGHSRQSAACSIFSMVLFSISDQKNFFNAHDLTVNFRTRNEGVIRISLVDYILDLVSPQKAGQRPPQKSFCILHNFLKTRCVIPKFLVQNKSYSG